MLEGYARSAHHGFSTFLRQRSSMRSLNTLRSLPRPRMSVDNGSVATKKGYRHEALPCNHTDRKLC